MRLKLKQHYFLLQIVLCASCASVPVQTSRSELRVKRQAGYGYDKPSVSFDLPSQLTVSTQAPNVDRTLEQQMFYAYPVPSGGNTVTSRQAAGSTSTATSGASAGGTAAGATAASAAGAAGGSSASGGYNYGTSNISGGYNYGPTSSGTQTANVGPQNVVTGSQSSGTGSASSGSGYGYNAPSPTLSPTPQRAPEVSTSAPRYLPPASGGGSAAGGSVSIGSVSVTPGSSQVNGSNSVQTNSGSSGSLEVPFEQYLPPLGTSGQVSSGYASSVPTNSGSTGFSGIPSDQYLPPLNSNTISSGPTVTSTSTGVQSNAGGSLSIPSSGYLSPNPLPSPSLPAPVLPSPAAPAIPTQNYLPPGSSSGSTGAVSTPAATYLPPVF